MNQNNTRASWEELIKRLGNELVLSTEKVKDIVETVKAEGDNNMPARYNGNSEEYFYDKAQRQLMFLYSNTY